MAEYPMPVKGAAIVPETSETGKRPAGLYRHPDSGAELVTLEDSLLGDAQSRAAERTGFQYVGPAPEGYVKTLGIASDDHAGQPERKIESDADELKGLRARLNALEDAQSRKANQEAAGTPTPGTEPVKGSDSTIQAASDKTLEQTGVQVDPSTGESYDQGYRELQAEAKELGVNAKGSREELTQRVTDAKAQTNTENEVNQQTAEKESE